MNFNNARQNMLLNQIRTWDFISPDNINLLRQVQREEFVPVEHRKLAFSDIEIPMSHGQYMMKPILEGRIIQSLNIEKTENILEIGTGSGYLTALLALSSKSVTSIDIHQDFTTSAIEKLKEANINNATCLCQDFYDFNSIDKFDCIVITGSIQETPDTLFNNLTKNGRIFALIGESPVMTASLISKTENDTTKIETLFETDVQPLIQTKQDSTFTL